jgi:uroporphyrinogen decarboxylase
METEPTMNGRDRVFGTIQAKEVDRRPYSACLFLVGAKLANCPLEHYFTDTEACIRGQQAVVELFNPDMVMSPLFMCSFARPFGSDIQYFDNQPPNLVKPVITSPEALDTIDIPDVDGHPDLRFTLQVVHRLKELYGNEKAIGAISMSPMEIPIMIFSLEHWMGILTDRDTDSIKRVMEAIIPFYVNYTNALFDQGADCVITPTAFTTPTVSTEAILTEIVVPILKQAFSQVKGPLVMHHVGGPYLPFLRHVKGLPNVLGYAVDPLDNLTEARSAIGEDYLLLGNMGSHHVELMTPDAIYKKVTHILEDRKHDPRFMFVTSGPDIPIDTPVENILAIRTAIENFG